MIQPIETAEGIPFYLIKTFVLVIGACFGSFANVVIHRVPIGKSIVRPGSMCPGCGHEIRWYENIPILSWVFLRGRCSGCGNPISIRYPLVELVVAVLSLACLFTGLSSVPDGMTLSTAQTISLWFFPFAFCFILVCITFIDLEHWIIPHVFTITGIILGVARSFLMGDLTGVSWSESLIGMAAGAIPLIIIIEGYYRLTGREGMGYGDVMLMAMAGAWLGYRSLPFILLASSIQGLVAAVPLLVLKRRTVPPWERNPEPLPECCETSGPCAGGNAACSGNDGPEDMSPADSAPPSASTGAPDLPDCSAASEGKDSTPEPVQTISDVQEARDASGDEPTGTGKMAIPFGPFIALSMMEWLFFGDLLLPLLFGL